MIATLDLIQGSLDPVGILSQTSRARGVEKGVKSVVETLMLILESLLGRGRGWSLEDVLGSSTLVEVSSRKGGSMRAA